MSRLRRSIVRCPVLDGVLVQEDLLAMPWHAMACHAMACYGMPWYAMACLGMLWHAMACRGMPWHAMACDFFTARRLKGKRTQN